VRGRLMSELPYLRQLIEIDPQNPPEVYSPQCVIVKAARSDGLIFKVDIGRVCYLEREKDSEVSPSGKNYTAGNVLSESLSNARTKWLRNYLSVAFSKGWRNETVRGALHYVRYFFHFCDFDGGSKPVELNELVSEYCRYQMILHQRGRLSGTSKLSATSIIGRLRAARNFIQWAFQMSNGETLSLMPMSRSLKSNDNTNEISVCQKDGQVYLNACITYFNQFSDAILENKYPVHVTPPNYPLQDLYWHAARGTTLKNLPDCFDSNGDPYPLKKIKSTLRKTLKSHSEHGFYKKTLVRSRVDWMRGELTSHKKYAFNLSVLCFFHSYLGFTAGNVQPTLDLRLSDIDLVKVGSSSFAHKHKFRSGRKVSFNAPGHLKGELLKYLRLRKWLDDLGLPGDAHDFLFVRIGEDGSIKRLERNSASWLIRESPLFKNIEKITLRDIRRLSSEYFFKKSKGKLSLVAKKLNNSIATVARAYSSIDMESQAIEMNNFHEEIAAKVRMADRDVETPIPVRVASESSIDRVAAGSCVNINGSAPHRVEGFNSLAPEPACGTFESCLFCEYFAVHVDYEDIHKLLSLREALLATSLIRNDPEHHVAVVQPAVFRVSEIVSYLSEQNHAARNLVSRAEKQIEAGVFNAHWSEQIHALTKWAELTEREV